MVQRFVRSLRPASKGLRGPDPWEHELRNPQCFHSGECPGHKRNCSQRKGNCGGPRRCRLCPTTGERGYCFRLLNRHPISNLMAARNAKTEGGCKSVGIQVHDAAGTAGPKESVGIVSGCGTIAIFNLMAAGIVATG